MSRQCNLSVEDRYHLHDEECGEHGLDRCERRHPTIQAMRRKLQKGGSWFEICACTQELILAMMTSITIPATGEGNQDIKMQDRNTI